MSHTGNRNLGRLRRLQSGPEKVHVPVVEDLISAGTLDSDVLEGEFQGNGIDVLIGLSSVKDFDNNLVFLPNQKGIAVGYLEGTTHFCAYSNAGTGAATAVTQFPVIKDRSTHLFKIVRDPTKVECIIDTSYKVTLTTNIPPFGEPLNIISYGLY